MLYRQTCQLKPPFHWIYFYAFQIFPVKFWCFFLMFCIYEKVFKEAPVIAQCIFKFFVFILYLLLYEILLLDRKICISNLAPHPRPLFPVSNETAVSSSDVHWSCQIIILVLLPPGQYNEIIIAVIITFEIAILLSSCGMITGSIILPQ